MSPHDKEKDRVLNLVFFYMISTHVWPGAVNAQFQCGTLPECDTHTDRAGTQHGYQLFNMIIMLKRLVCFLHF